MQPLPTEQTPCRRCRALPRLIPDEGTLYLHPPLDHTRASLRDFLAGHGVTVSEPLPGVLCLELGAGQLREWGEGFPKVLSPSELLETRSLIVAPGTTPTLADFLNTRPLSSLVAAVQGEWLIEVLQAERLETHFQPIVHTRRPDQVFAYECLVRGRDAEGRLIGPDRLFGAARTADLLFHLDRQSRLLAVRSAGRHGLDTHVFINFNPTSIYNPVSCLRSTVQAVTEIGGQPGRFVFEVVESDEVRDTKHLLGILDYYRAEGFQVALDDVGAGFSSLNLLASLRPDFIKVDMHLIRGVDRDPTRAEVVSKLLEMARGLGIGTVVEGIETEEEWHWVREHGADYAQGYLFARPATPPPVPRCPPGPGMMDGRGECRKASIDMPGRPESV